MNGKHTRVDILRSRVAAVAVVVLVGCVLIAWTRRDQEIQVSSRPQDSGRVTDIDERTVAVPASPQREPSGTETFPSEEYIVGRVEAPTGDPIARARLQLTYEGQVVQSEESNGEGAFLFEQLTHATYGLSVSADRFGDTSFEAIEPDVYEFVVVLTPRTSIQGRVVDAVSGAPVPSFEIRLLPEVHEFALDWIQLLTESSTDWQRFENGTFTIQDISSNEWFSVGARADGYAGDYVETSPIPPGERRRTTIKLYPESRITGSVLTSDGHPIVDASIHFEEIARPPVARSDELGRFELSGLPRVAIWIVASHPDYFPGGAQTSDLSDNQHVEIVLSGGGAIEGVVTQNRSPLWDYSVLVVRLEKPRFDQEVSTDEFGRYHIRDVPPGQYLVGLREKKTYLQTIMARVDEGETTRVDLELPAARSRLMGVVSMYGQPVPDVSLSIAVYHRGQESQFRATTNARGEYQTEPMPSGLARINVYVSPQGDSAGFYKNFEVEIPPDEEKRYDIELGGSATISGIVSGLAHNEIAVVYAIQGNVDPFAPENRRINLSLFSMGQASVKPDGSYLVRHLPPGQYNLVLVPLVDPDADDTRATNSAAQITVEVSDGEQLTADFSL